MMIPIIDYAMFDSNDKGKEPFHLPRLYCTIVHAFLWISFFLLLSQSPYHSANGAVQFFGATTIFLSLLVCSAQYGEAKKCIGIQYPYFLFQFYFIFLSTFITFFYFVGTVYFFLWSFRYPERRYADDALGSFIAGSLNMLLGAANTYYGYILPIKNHRHPDEEKKPVEDKLEMPY
ncbi:hypothetical protein M3Y97_01104300 [Aphelenchoides bicaudatus]|nr:hypothetical protein M3Y97_01104300 [Aphelenchoides bicaudatus]